MLAIATSFLNVALEYVDTEKAYPQDWFHRIDIAACSIFLSVYALKWYVAQHRLQYILSV